MKKIDIEKGSKRADARFRITVEETGPYLVYGQPPLAQQFIMPDAEGESWYFQQGAHFRRRCAAAAPRRTSPIATEHTSTRRGIRA